jgi:hypothetical protein
LSTGAQRAKGATRSIRRWASSTDVIDAIDKLVEAYQGAFSLIGNIPAPSVTERDVLKLLEADAEWIEEHHEDICKGNRAVANLIDGVTEVYLTTIYKLRNLK